MGFSLSGAASGALGGAGTGSMFGPGWGTVIGAGVGGLMGGFMQSEEPSYEMSPEQQQALDYERQIASGQIESPEVLQMRAQGNKGIAASAGLMGQNRGATQGAKSAYITGMAAEQGARLNEGATAANAAARQTATRNVASVLGGQQKLNIEQANNEANRQSNFLAAMTQLGAQGATSYLENQTPDVNKNPTGQASNALGLMNQNKKKSQNLGGASIMDMGIGG